MDDMGHKRRYKKQEPKNRLEENIKLSGKLAEYIADNPAVIANMPKGTSFVVFSRTNKKLNKANKGLVASLKKEGKKVVKVVQGQNKAEPWSFSAAI